MIDIVEEPIEMLSLVEWARTDSDGAIVTFQGAVRDFNEGRVVLDMEYHCYRELALNEMKKLEAEIKRRWPEGRIAMVHRIGPMQIGETSVAIVATSPHRPEAFDACRFAIDELKRTVPIWKKERYADSDAEWVKGVTGRSVGEGGEDIS
jgi:molybdopterin synthase catalytic subunit